jgi:hypothetical protein
VVYRGRAEAAAYPHVVGQQEGQEAAVVSREERRGEDVVHEDPKRGSHG